MTEVQDSGLRDGLKVIFAIVTAKFVIIIMFCSLILFLFGNNKETRIKEIPNKRCLVYDVETHIVYMNLSSDEFTPFYSENGKLCKYERGIIIEINNSDNEEKVIEL